MAGPEKLKDELVKNLAAIREVALGAIGVAGGTIDPATEFGDLGKESLKVEWLSGAVQPVTMRGLASLLVRNLPKNTLQKIGMAILEAGLDDELGEEPCTIQSLAKIASYDDPELNSFTLEPYVSINPNASGRQVQPEIAKLLKSWKAEYQLSEKRNNSPSEESYLKVWDLREGWSDGAYSLFRELKLRDVAKELKIPISTAHTRYKRAFEIISGHTYSVRNWVDLMGPLKLSSLSKGNSLGGLKRNITQKAKRDVPSSKLRLTGDSEASFVDLNSIVSPTNRSVLDDFEDLKELISRGKSNREIFLEFDAKETEDGLRALDALRERLRDCDLRND